MFIEKILLQKLGGSFLAIFLCFFPLSVWAEGVSLAEWTFPNNPDNSLVDSATPENETELLSAMGTAAPTFATSGATTNSARATGWQNGAETKYWSFAFNSIDHKNILLSVKLRSSATGPKNFTVQYRLDEDAAWINVTGGNITVADNFTTGALELLPLPGDTDNQERVFVRIIMASNQSVGGNLVTSTGANRLDDLIISASTLVEEEDEPTPGSQCAGLPDTVRLNEIFPYPAVSDQEYAELFNTGDQCVNLSGWRLEDGGNHKYIFPLGAIIEPGDFFTITRNLYLNNTSADSLTLFTQENELVSEVSYEQALKGLSYSFNDLTWLFSSTLTPGSENIFDEVDETEEETPTEFSTSIIINEILPNPKTDEAKNEFIELKNIGAEAQDLSGWSLYDASNKIFTLPDDTTIAVGGFLTFFRTDFAFALNNTGTDSVTLVDPSGNTVSKVEYSTPQENFSYSFTGDEFRFTKKITPGGENEFSKVAKVTLSSKKKGFTDVPLVFRADIKGAKKPYRYSWDFGDGRRSTLAEPKHTFTKSGKYTVTLTIRAKDQTVTKEFEITIRKFPRHDVLITALQPNPKGKDTGQEWIEIKNLSQKSLDLTGWKVASGTEDPVNHPFTRPLILTPKQVLRLTRSDAAFSLPNSQGVIELRYPNDVVASKTVYDEEEIDEDAICLNTDGLCKFTDLKKESEEKSGLEEEADESDNDGDVLGVNTENTLSDNLADLPTTNRKRELVRNIKRDLNSLFNEIISDVLQKNP